MTEITRLGGVKPEGHCRGTPGGQFMAAQLGGCSVCRRANGVVQGISVPPLEVRPEAVQRESGALVRKVERSKDAEVAKA